MCLDVFILLYAFIYYLFFNENIAHVNIVGVAELNSLSTCPPMFAYDVTMSSPDCGELCHWECCWHTMSMFLGMKGVLVFYNIFCHVWCHIQDEHYEEEDGADERILGSNFSPGRNTEVLELPDIEALFMPTNMDSSQMAFKFKEVLSLYVLSDLTLHQTLHFAPFFILFFSTCLFFSCSSNTALLPQK